MKETLLVLTRDTLLFLQGEKEHPKTFRKFKLKEKISSFTTLKPVSTKVSPPLNFKTDKESPPPASLPVNSTSAAFERENLSLSDTAPPFFKELRQIFKKVAPHVAIIQELPKEIVIIDSSKTAAEKEFLKQLTRAIQQHLAPCRLIDISLLKKEHHISLVLASKDVALSESMPVLRLEDLSLYVTDPSLKKSLWRKLHDLLQSHV